MGSLIASGKKEKRFIDNSSPIIKRPIFSNENFEESSNKQLVVKPDKASAKVESCTDRTETPVSSSPYRGCPIRQDETSIGMPDTKRQCLWRGLYSVPGSRRKRS